MIGSFAQISGRFMKIFNYQCFCLFPYAGIERNLSIGCLYICGLHCNLTTDDPIVNHLPAIRQNSEIF